MGATNSTSNFTFDPGYDETVYLYPEDSAFWIILFSFIIGLGTFAVVSNLMFLITVISDPALRKTRLSVYLVDMSVIDTLSSIGYIVFAGFNIEALNPRFTKHFVLDAFFSFFVLNLRNTFQLLSSVLIICIAWERYKAVCRPFETMASSRHLKLHAAVVSCGTITLLMVFMTTAFVVQSFRSFPISLWYSFHCDDTFENRIRSCYNERHLVFESVPLIYCVLILTDFLTLAISMTVFCIIIRRIKQSPALGVSNRHLKEERNLTNMAFVNNVAFVVLVLLQDFSTLLVIVFATSSFPKSGVFVYNLQAIWNLLNSAANPIIYNIFGTRYRRAMMKTFSPCTISSTQKRQETTGTCTTTDTCTTADFCTDGGNKTESSTSPEVLDNVEISAV